MTDFRALCAELADSVELLLEMRAVDAKPMAITEDRFFRARAALAQPEPQGPTDEELRALWRLGWQSNDPEDGAVLFAKEVLARWGHPISEEILEDFND